MTKYLVVGSPGRYRLQAVRPGGKDYQSGMSAEAAEKTKIALNAEYYRKKNETPPISSVTPDESKLDLNRDKLQEFVDVFTTNFYPPTGVAKALADPTKTITENIAQAFEPGSNNVDTSSDWILISKTLYEGPGIVSQINNTGAITTTPDTLLWYNTGSKNTRPGNEVPESAIINNQPIKEGSLGVPGEVSNETFNIWTEANKESVIEDTLGIDRNSSMIKLQAAAKKAGIRIPDFGEEIGTENRKKVLYNLIRADQQTEINDAIELAKSKISASNVNVVTPKVENKTPQEVQDYLNATQITLYKNNTEKVVDFRTADSYIQDGWSTEKPENLVTSSELSSLAGSDFGRLVEQGYVSLSDAPTDLPTDLPSDEGEVVIETPITGGEVVTGTGLASESSGQMISNAQSEFLNVPKGAWLWDVDGANYLVYEVPGANGEVYEGNPIYMAYEVMDNDLVKAGIVSPEAPTVSPNAKVNKAFFDSVAIVTGNTDQLSSLIDNPFASFVETINEQSQVAPWITDPEMISLIAEAAVEGREISDAEWQTTNWYQTNNQSQRDWLRTYYADPATATQTITDGQIAVANSLQAAGVSNAPEALVNWISSKYVTGDWSQTYTTEQISLFADPYAEGKRDESLENYLSSTALTGVDRTTEREREVTELYNKWLGPTLGKLTDNERAEIAGKLRDDPDYEDALISSLKQSRLAAFSNYTNPELTYEDIARPWRNLTTSVWGQTADETQGWWQEMVKTNDFAKAQTTLREKGLEQDITQVTTDATQALQQALGQGSVSQTGVNV